VNIRLLWALPLLLATVLTAADISGKWTFNVETSGGSGTPSFVIKQDGEKLTGTYSGLFGERPFTGTLKGNQVTIEVKVEVEGNAATVVYTGEVESNTKMKGKVKLGEIGEGTWTGTKN
jgi:hypothetical protein